MSRTRFLNFLSRLDAAQGGQGAAMTYDVERLSRLLGRRRDGIATVDGSSPTRLPGMAIWRTIELGDEMTIEDLRVELIAAGCAIGDRAAQALDNPALSVATARATVELVRLTVGALGFAASEASYQRVCETAARVGLARCLPEVALRLRLTYRDQPIGEFLRIAMEPIETRNRGPTAFIVGNGGAHLLLLGCDAGPSVLLAPTTRLVFMRPQRGVDL